MIFLQYRIEFTGRGRWGGIWIAPSNYSLIDETGTQTQVTGMTYIKTATIQYSNVFCLCIRYVASLKIVEKI